MFQLVVILALVAVSSAERVYPCADTPTQECFAKYFEEVGGCVSPSELLTSNVFETPDTVVEMPYFRTTINRYDTSAEIAHDFADDVLYHDEESQLTVYTTLFQSATLTGRALVEYHILGEEDITLDTEWSITYSNVSTTAIYSGVDQINIGSAKIRTEIESFSLDLDADFAELEAALLADTTGVISAVHALFEEHPDIYLREHEPPTGRQIFVPFFETNICSRIQNRRRF